jgi:hypothetical protein
LLMTLLRKCGEVKLDIEQFELVKLCASFLVQRGWRHALHELNIMFAVWEKLRLNEAAMMLKWRGCTRNGVGFWGIHVTRRVGVMETTGAFTEEEGWSIALDYLV